jgi:hypothetical protein
MSLHWPGNCRVITIWHISGCASALNLGIADISLPKILEMSDDKI